MANAAAKQWATVWVDTPNGRTTLEALTSLAVALDEVGALLALRDDVSGVQSFDAASSETGRPRLRIFTLPGDVDAVERAARELLTGFEVDANLHSEVRDDEEWRDTWKQFYRPLVFGDHQLLLRPSWIERGEGDPALEVILDPGRAFGTGLHQSTALCLERLCTLAKLAPPPRSIVDIGCGSGVLALAAAKLFPDAGRILALDVDPEAAETTRENATDNQLTARIDVRCAEASELGDERFDLLIANIRPVVLIPAAKRFLGMAGPGARAILSGILDEEADGVADAYTAAGWAVDRQGGGGRRRLATWTSLDMVRS